jgi:hypothetical protein
LFVGIASMAEEGGKSDSEVSSASERSAGDSLADGGDSTGEPAPKKARVADALLRIKKIAKAKASKEMCKLLRRESSMLPATSNEFGAILLQYNLDQKERAPAFALGDILDTGIAPSAEEQLRLAAEYVETKRLWLVKVRTVFRVIMKCQSGYCAVVERRAASVDRCCGRCGWGVAGRAFRAHWAGLLSHVWEVCRLQPRPVFWRPAEARGP